MMVDKLSGRLVRLRKEIGSNYLATVQVTSKGVRLLATWSPKYQELAECEDSADFQALRRLKKSGARQNYIG